MLRVCRVALSEQWSSPLSSLYLWHVSQQITVPPRWHDEHSSSCYNNDNHQQRRHAIHKQINRSINQGARFASALTRSHGERVHQIQPPLLGRRVVSSARVNHNRPAAIVVVVGRHFMVRQFIPAHQRSLARPAVLGAFPANTRCRVDAGGSTREGEGDESWRSDGASKQITQRKSERAKASESFRVSCAPLRLLPFSLGRKAAAGFSFPLLCSGALEDVAVCLLALVSVAPKELRSLSAAFISFHSVESSRRGKEGRIEVAVLHVVELRHETLVMHHKVVVLRGEGLLGRRDTLHDVRRVVAVVSKVAVDARLAEVDLLALSAVPPHSDDRIRLAPIALSQQRVSE